MIHKKLEQSLTGIEDKVPGCRVQEPGLMIQQPKLRVMKYKDHICNFFLICYKVSCLRQYDLVNMTYMVRSGLCDTNVKLSEGQNIVIFR